VRALGAAESAAALVAQAPEVIARLGFDRVLVSRVVDDVWVPDAMFVRTDAAWAAAIVEAGCEEPTVLKAVVENDVVTSGCTFVVEQVQTHPRVHQRIAYVSRSDNYGVAPLTIGSSVVGMVHADCYLQQRPVTAPQCETLAIVAECLAAHLGRLMLIDQNPALEASNTRGHEPERPPLTVRETEILRLMAGGADQLRHRARPRNHRRYRQDPRFKHSAQARRS
jgi:hypothetical protein